LSSSRRLAGVLGDGQVTVCGKHGEARAVVAAILKLGQALHDVACRAFRADVANDSAHNPSTTTRRSHGPLHNAGSTGAIAPHATIERIWGCQGNRDVAAMHTGGSFVGTLRAPFCLLRYDRAGRETTRRVFRTVSSSSSGARSRGTPPEPP
jgi:hypothetical protein